MNDVPYRIKKPAVLDQIPHDNHAVIEASAGTGKTYTIEHLVVDLLLDDPELRISEVLIVTFTERATFELTGRIRRLLQGIVDARPALLAAADDDAWSIDAGRRRRLQRALSGFDTAPIHTIHGFCHRVLTENAFQNHRLFDQDHAEFDVLFDRVFKQALRQEFAHRASLRPYLRAWLKADGRSVDSLRKVLADCIRSRAAVEPAFDEAELTDALAAFDDWTPQEIPAVLKAELDDEDLHHATVRATVKRVSGLMDGLRAYRRDDAGAAIDFLARAGAAKTYDYLSEKLADYAFDGPVGERLRRAMDAVVPLEAAVVGAFLPPLESMFRRHKQVEGHFSYDDMLAIVADSLAGARGPALVAQLRQRYRYALIDEFQDTDDLQWTIFRRLFLDSDAQNLFYLIGDPKQAIYSFRGADVYTYLEAKQTVIDHGGELVRLGKNYRSSPAVVAAYNCIFDQRADPSFFRGDITYDQPVECGLVDRRVVDADGQPAPAIRLAQLVDDDLDARRVREGFAGHFAGEIRRLMTQDPTLRVHEDADSPADAVDAGDIFVLTRSRSEGRFFARYLRRQGVPYAFFKQDGLFQTDEAHHIYDLLDAVAHPDDRSKRLKAWLTPFFGLALADLDAPGADAFSAADPLVEDLFAWQELAQKRWFETLFNDILTESGLLRREIFTKTSERELTNYLHIFEVLLEEAIRSGHDLAELVGRLQGFIDERVSPLSEDGTIQRLETDGDAVQIMTMHKAKGLEAEVVFIYGGFGRGPSGPLRTFHDDDGGSILYVGTPPAGAKQRWEREQAAEEQRLMYVALTRAKSQMYLPYIGYTRDAETRDYAVKGSYRPLMARLDAIVDGQVNGSPDDSPGKDQQTESALFALDQVDYAQTVPADDPGAQARAVSQWSPPDSLPIPFGDELFEPLRRRRFVVSSYSRIKDRPADLGAGAGPSIDEILGDEDLPGGKRAGVFLHELVEQLDIDRARQHQSLADFVGDVDIDRQFRQAMGRYGIDAGYAEFCKTLVWNSVTTPLSKTLPSVAGSDRILREVEFVYPIPERGHPRLDALAEAGFAIDRGFVKGFIDLLIEVDGRVYFADWKSDILPDYGADALDAHVRRRYALQATLYSVAVVKYLDIHDKAAFEERFGGYFYLFMRGLGTGDAGSGDKPGGAGIYTRRPSWQDVLGYERRLRDEMAF